MTKLLRGVALVLPLVLMSVLITAFKADTPPQLTGIIVLLHTVLVFVGALFGMLAAVFATNYNWFDPRYMVNPASVYLFMVLTLIFGGLGVGILYGGFYLHQQGIAFVVFFVYVSVVLSAGLLIAVRRLRKLEWIY